MVSKNAYVQIDIKSNFNSEKNSQMNISNNVNIKNDCEENEWVIEIPKLSLKAYISNGTDEKTLNNYVGHFEESEYFYGNVCLAAHNRGYSVNYFERLNELKTNDEIIYRYNGESKKYIVKIHEIISETDWHYLEKTSDNRITLITCVENKPEYRRCIQAIEKKEE